MAFLRREFTILIRLLRQPALWVLLGLAALGIGAAYQNRQAITVDVGTPADTPYLSNFHEIRSDPDGRSYRASDAYGYVVLPGLGGGVPVSLTLSLNPGRAAAPVTVLINGEDYGPQPLAAG